MKAPPTTYSQPAASQVEQTIHLVTDDLVSEARARLGVLCDVVDATDLRRWLALAIAGGDAGHGGDPIGVARGCLMELALGDAYGVSGPGRETALSRRASELRRWMDDGDRTTQTRARLAIVEAQ